MPEQRFSDSVTLFYSYAYEDEALRKQLEQHLALLQRQGLLLPWHHRQIEAGEDWKHAIGDHLEAASIILLLISPAFLASDYCYEVEMRRALERQRAGEARVIPLLLRPCDWHTAPFGHLQALPRDGRAITTWTNQDEAFLQVTQSLRTLLAQPIPRNKMNEKETQNRATMLVKLQRMYSEMLDDSLQKLAWIDLSLSSAPGAVHTPANVLLRRTHLPTEPLASGTTIQQVYQQANQELLILGEPGAGKSTLLYHLGLDLLPQVQHSQRLLPVVFPLSSWSKLHLPLEQWMVEQLCSPLYYDIARWQSQQWVHNQQILPLLDGLDEVEEAARPACIAAINTFRSTFPLCPLVVCSRSQEYDAASQHERLHLYSAVEVQPLTAIQQEEALRQAGSAAEGLRAALAINAGLRELVHIPLWFNMLLVTSREAPLPALPQEHDALQQEILRRYVERMCERKGDTTRYPLKQTLHWFGFLASQMSQRNQVIFALEELQPDWLTRNSRRAYHWSVSLIGGLVFGLIGGLAFGGPAGRLAFELPGGLLSGLVFGLFVGLKSEVRLAEHLVWSWKGIRRGLFFGLFFGLIYGPLCGLVFGLLVGLLFAIFVGLFFGLLAGLVEGLLFGLFFGLFVGLFFGLFVGLFGGLKNKGRLAKRLVWSWKGIRRGLLAGLLAGLAAGLVFGLFGRLLIGLLAGLLFAIFVGLVFGMSGELERKQGVDRDTSSPGKGVSRSVRNGLFVGLLAGLVFGLVFGPFGGLLAGLLVGLVGGLESAFEHQMLRFWLACTNCLPWRVIAFLNDAHERALLKRVGGTYRFIHRLVLEYFADQERLSSQSPLDSATADMSSHTMQH